MMKDFYKSWRALASKHRSFKSNTRLGMFLIFIAGALNAGGFYIFNQYTSHMTGLLSSASDNVAIMKYTDAIFLIFYIFCFILGAGVTTIFVIKAREHKLHSQYAIPLLFESIILIIIFFLLSNFDVKNIPTSIMLSTLCFIMGLQNALITKTSRATIRTTHITGMATDLGIEMGKVLLRKKNISTESTFAKVHIVLILMFFLGGLVGAVSFKFIGHQTVLPISILISFITLPHFKKDFLFMAKSKKRKS